MTIQTVSVRPDTLGPFHVRGLSIDRAPAARDLTGSIEAALGPRHRPTGITDLFVSVTQMRMKGPHLSLLFG